MGADDAAALARLLDALRDGTSWALEGERLSADAIRAAWPGVKDALRFYDRFRSSAAADAVLHGMTAIVLGAGGYPRGSIHQAAAAASGTARFLYPEPDQVIAGQRALSLRDDGQAMAITGSICDPRRILRGAGLLGRDDEWLGDGPCQVQWGLAAMLMDGEEAAALAASYRELLPPGSEIVIAIPDGAQGRELARAAGARPHTAGDMEAWCEKADLDLDEPADVRAWGREVLAGGLSGDGGRFTAVTGTVPG